MEILSNFRHQSRDQSSTRHRPLSLPNPSTVAYWARSAPHRKPSTSQSKCRRVNIWQPITQSWPQRKCSKEMVRSISVTSLSTLGIESWSIKTFFGRSSGRRIWTAQSGMFSTTALKGKNRWSDGTPPNSIFFQSRSWMCWVMTAQTDIYQALFACTYQINYFDIKL